MKTIQGNLIELAQQGHFDVIVHGCNCFNTMGAGIAKQIAHAFPQAQAADLQTTKGDLRKLGTISYALSPLENDQKLIVVNAYTQYFYGQRHKAFNYTALENAFKLVKQNFEGLRIAYPAIGAGLGKGDWIHIAPIIDRILQGEDHTFVAYAYKSCPRKP